MHESKLQILDLMLSVEALQETYDCLRQLQKEAEQAIREIEVLTSESNPELLLLVKALGVLLSLPKRAFLPSSFCSSCHPLHSIPLQRGVSENNRITRPSI